jgi:hypothetical protein
LARVDLLSHAERFEQRLPWLGRQKSTTMVVPPESAARVPLSKSSEE